MDWADELAAGVSGPQVVNDSKTPSGTVHVGSLRGPVILDVIARALRHAGLDTTSRFAHAELHHAALQAARQAALAMRANDEIGDDAFHRIEEELDWIEMSSRRNGH